MTHSDPLNDVVSCQYERWIYPEPIVDLPLWLKENWQWFDPSHAHRIFWPDRSYKPDLDILIAGCGTNQAAVFAYTNPQARVVAVDVSQASLGHHKQLKDHYGLSNLELHRLPIESVASLDRSFDLIVSTGVLHHLAEPERGLQALAGCLRPEGVVAIMLYARHGRIGVEMLQGVFRELGLHQDDASVLMVKEALATLPADHPLMSYLKITSDLQSDAGLVDTFLHGRDRSFTVPDCLELVEGAGLVFQDWFLRTPYYPPILNVPNSASYAEIDRLPTRQMWSVMERLRNLNGCHFFMACRPERATSSYRIDFSDSRALDYVPLWRHQAGVTGDAVFRSDWTVQLGPTDLAIAQSVDGDRSIRDIATRVVDSGVIRGTAQADAEQIALDLFEQLWRTDFLAVDLSAIP